MSPCPIRTFGWLAAAGLRSVCQILIGCLHGLADLDLRGNDAKHFCYFQQLR